MREVMGVGEATWSATRGSFMLAAGVVDILKTEPDERTIHWFWEPKGNVGKTTLCKWLVVKHWRVESVRVHTHHVGMAQEKARASHVRDVVQPHVLRVVHHHEELARGARQVQRDHVVAGADELLRYSQRARPHHHQPRVRRRAQQPPAVAVALALLVALRNTDHPLVSRVAVCGSSGFNTEPRDSPNEPQASPPGGFPSAVNRGLPYRTLH